MNRTIYVGISLAVSIIISFAAGLSFADTVTQEWASTYNGSSNLADTVADLAVDNYGNVYVTGSSKIGSNIDITTVKYSASGVEQWVRNFDGGSSLGDSAASITVDASGNIYVAGQSTSSASLALCRLIKYNSAGTQQWTKTYQGASSTGTNLFADVTTDGPGNIYVVGGCTGITTGFDYLTIKYNSGGSKVWDMNYNSSGTNTDIATAIKLDSSLNVYVTGIMGTIKYNNAGVRQWIDANFSCMGLGIDSSSNVYTLAVSGSNFSVVKYNSAGVRQWASPYPLASGTVQAEAIAVDAAGNSYITGMFNDGTQYILTAKFDKDGLFLWDAFYDASSSNSYTGSIAADQWGNSYTTGIVNRNLVTIKYDSDGNQKWNMLYAANQPNNEPVPVVVKSGEVYVGGSSVITIPNYNYVTIKYSQHFCKANRIGDLNGDCKVNFLDLAEMSASWAECNLYPTSDCD